MLKMRACEPEMHIRVSMEGEGTCVVQCAGDVDIEGAPELHAALELGLREARQKLILDLRDSLDGQRRRRRDRQGAQPPGQRRRDVCMHGERAPAHAPGDGGAHPALHEPGACRLNHGAGACLALAGKLLASATAKRPPTADRRDRTGGREGRTAPRPA